MNSKTSTRSGKISPATVLIIIVLTGLALVTGWWYGGAGEINPAKATSPGHGKWDKPRLKGPSSGSAPDAAGVILEDRVADIAEAALPSVVSVFTERSGAADPHADPMFRFFYGPNTPRPPPGPQFVGSGVIVSEDGYILTNNHVVEDAMSVKVVLGDRSEYYAEVVGTDPASDIAVLKIEAEGLPTMALADSDRARVGQVALAIGAPFGFSQTVTMGIVSARGRSMGMAEFEDFIQTDASINPGNSGGALINLSGDMIGLNTAIYSRSGGDMGVGFAIPANTARRAMESLIEKGVVERGYLGINIQRMDQTLADIYDLESPEGALVTQVITGSPAEKAGIEEDDVIVAVNGAKVVDNSDLMNRIARIEPGATVKLTIIRNGMKMTKSATLGTRPDKEEMERVFNREHHRGEADLAGMSVSELTEEVARSMGLDRAIPGVVVTEIEAGSRAAKSKLRVGDVITKVGGQKVTDLASFKRAARKAGDDILLLHIKRQGQSMRVAIPSE